MTGGSRVTRRHLLALGSTTVAGSISGCSSVLGGNSGPSVESVRVVLNWKPNPTQAGYFAARERGYYDDEGLDVEFVPGRGGSFATKQVGLDNAEFGLGAGVAVLQARAEDLSVRSYAAAQQSSNAALFTIEEQFGAELTDPEQLAGSRIAVASGGAKTRAYLLSMLESAGVRDSVEIVDVGAEQQTANLLSGNVDVATAIFSNALALDDEGYDASMLLVGNHVPTIGRTVIARPGFVDDHPETVRAFLTGTARGWAWASNNPRKAESVMIDAEPRLAESRELGVAKIKYTAKRLIATDEVTRHGWGWQSSDTWASVHETLAANDVLPVDLSVDAAWTNEFRDESDQYVSDYADQIRMEYDVPV